MVHNDSQIQSLCCLWEDTLALRACADGPFLCRLDTAIKGWLRLEGGEMHHLMCSSNPNGTSIFSSFHCQLTTSPGSYQRIRGSYNLFISARWSLMHWISLNLKKLPLCVLLIESQLIDSVRLALHRQAKKLFQKNNWGDSSHHGWSRKHNKNNFTPLCRKSGDVSISDILKWLWSHFGILEIDIGRSCKSLVWSVPRNHTQW